jgi:hypothetical protein
MYIYRRRRRRRRRRGGERRRRRRGPRQLRWRRWRHQTNCSLI